MTAGTPLPFVARVWGRDTLDVLEFEAVLERVATHAAGAAAAARIKARRPHTDPSHITDELADVSQAAALVRGGEGLSIPAAPDATAVLARLRLEGGVMEPGDLVVVRRLCRAAGTTLAELRRVAEAAPRLRSLIVSVPAATITRRLERVVDDDGRLLDTASPALAAARKAVHQARGRLIGKLETVLRGIDGDGAVTVRGGRYVIPVRRDQRQRPPGIIHDESASQGTLYIEPTAAIELGNALREAEVAEERAVLEVLRELTDLLRPDVELFTAALEMCIAADELQARAAYAADVDGHCPAVDRTGHITIQGGRHPLLLNGADPVVPFSLALEASEHTVVVSGPNTGGKTVLLKAVGLIAAMAQSGLIPPVGPGTRLPVFRQCFADIGDHQSIAANLSTFSAHLFALRHILEQADERTLVLIDEMGSGTDPTEGAALAAAALSALTRRGATTIATTHLGALKELPERIPQVVNASLEFDPESLEPTYRFRKGIPGRSYGLAIGRRLGLDAAVLAEAEAGLPEVGRALETLLASVELRERAVRNQEQRLSDGAQDLERRGAKLQRRETEFDGRAAALEAREREAEREGRTRAKAYLLAARQRVEEALGLARGAADAEAARQARRLVEEGVQAQADALASTVGGHDAEEPSDAPVALGRRVRLSSGLEGTIVEQRGDGRWVVAAGAVQTAVRQRDIVGVLADKPRRAPAEVTVAPAPARLEVDLRGLTGDEAEAATLAAIDHAVLAGQPYLRIIHGMGTGVVRARVRQVLEHDTRVDGFAHARPQEGGTGVTIVEFRS
jgi:DNA mismatch repair protein MutS2